MSNRYHSLTVVLKENLREDDAEPILAAIRQLRGVLSVTGVVVDPTSHMAQERAKCDLGKKLIDVLYPPNQ